MDAIDYPRFIMAFALILGLIGLMGWLLKRFGKRTGWQSKGAGRVQVVEITPLDYKRRLVLVRRDNVEHLLLISDGREIVIESGIDRGMIKATHD